MITHTKLSILGGAALIALVSFITGWAVGGSEFATSINTGLATAFDSVGKNLLGRAVFSAAVMIPTDPCAPTDPCNALQLSFADNAAVPIATNIFNKLQPVDPCKTYLQVAIANGVATVKYDSAAAPQGFNAEFQSADLSSVVPATSQCSVAPICNPNTDTCP